MFLHLRDRSKTTEEKLFTLLAEAEDARQREAEAAELIQRVWKGYNARLYISYLHEQAKNVQKVWRGYRDRRFCKLKRQRLQYARKKMYYDAMATLIQKVFRGYYSRKTIEDCQKRSEWLNETRQKSEAMRQEMHVSYLLQKKENQEKEELLASRKFEHLTENLHHLVSTKAIPGIFNSRFGDMYQITAFDIPMDDHLREAFRNRREREKVEKEAKRMLRVSRRMDSLQQSSMQSSSYDSNNNSTRFSKSREGKRPKSRENKVVLPVLNMSKTRNIEQQRHSRGGQRTKTPQDRSGNNSTRSGFHSTARSHMFQGNTSRSIHKNEGSLNNSTQLSFRKSQYVSHSVENTLPSVQKQRLVAQYL